MQEPDELKVFDGHDETHFPPDASWLLAHVKQNVDDPVQLLHDESHAIESIQLWRDIVSETNAHLCRSSYPSD